MRSIQLHQSAIFATFLLIIFFSPKSSAFRLVQNADFNYCFNTYVINFNISNITDTNQYFRYDSVTGQRINPDRPLLSLQGCENLCHDGYQLRPLRDTLSRLVVFPAIVLISHYHFAPLGVKNTVAVIIHLTGDPIDSIWSMLTRQEANRRFYRCAVQSKLIRDQTVATIWSSYDELGWQDAAFNFFRSLKMRESAQRCGRRSSGSYNSARGSSTTSRGSKSVSRSPRGQSPFSRGHYGLLDTDSTSKLDEPELYLIQIAAQRITSNRSDSGLQTWVAIISMIGAEVSAFLHTVSSEVDNQQYHTIVIVTLLFIFISLVKISGNIGAFTSSTTVLDIIQELRRDLAEHNNRIGLPKREPLFPALYFDGDSSWHPEESQQLEVWQQKASSLTPKESKRRRWIDLFRKSLKLQTEEKDNVPRKTSNPGIMVSAPSFPINVAGADAVELPQSTDVEAQPMGKDESVIDIEIWRHGLQWLDIWE